MQIFPELIDFAAADGAALESFINETAEQIRAVAADPSAFVTDDFTTEQLLDATRAASENLRAAREAHAALTADVEPVEVPEDAAAELAALAADVDADVEEETEETPEEPEPTLAAVPDPEPVEPVVEEPVVAAAPAPARRSLPARSRSAAPVVPAASDGALRVSLVASAAGLGPEVGAEIDAVTVGAMMEKKRRSFGKIPEGESGQRIGIAQFSWEYPEDRRLTDDPVRNAMLIAAAIDDNRAKTELARRRKDALTASGGLCAPLTPYYDLANVSTASRPVRDSLPGFSADRGGIRYARPALLTDIDTAVGRVTAADDALGGTFATKACQVVECPPFQDTVIAAIYHCLQIGNLLGRTYPELIAQWNNLVLAYQARLAESQLLTDIDDFSTSVTGASVGAGAIADLLPQVLQAAVGMRSRHRMSEDTVLRVMMPSWAIPLMVTDALRAEFERFDTDSARIIAKMREFNVEPTFYVDGAAGAGQVFGAQAAGTLDTFPEEVRWYIFPEGAFLFLDGGTLELGLVRDSVLNATNDYQLFGETFENVAFLGVESLAVTSEVCPSGATSAPVEITC